MAKRTSKNEEDVEAYRHETDTRKNIVPAGLASYDTAKPKPKKYEYDPHLDPQLVWKEKAEHTFFEVPTVSLHMNIECVNLSERSRFVHRAMANKTG